MLSNSMTSHAVDIGAVDGFEPGTPYRVTVGDRALVVVRRDGQFYALRDTCPHQGAPLSDGRVTGTTLKCDVGGSLQYGRDGEILRCPWHGWQFDIKTGCSLVDPAKTRVGTYSVRVEGGRVVVDVG